MKKVITTFLFLLTLSLTLATSGYGNQTQERNQEHIEEFLATGEHTGDMIQEQNRTRVRDQITEQLKQKDLAVEQRIALETRLKNLNSGASATNFKEELLTGQEITISNGAKIKRINGELEINKKDKQARTMLNLTEDAELGLQARLSNGQNAQIKIMPETASEKALTRLRLKNCNESRNCTIELKEVGDKNQTRAAYEIKAEKTFRIFGLFKNQETISTEIDAETGDEIQTRRPWWSFLATESEE